MDSGIEEDSIEGMSESCDFQFWGGRGGGGRTDGEE